MAERVLTILEVSQKQAYIFSSNKLRDNLTNSAVIAWVMSGDYFQEKIGNKDVFDGEKNFVYSGGGHVVLEFETMEKARGFTRRITRAIYEEYPGIAVFAASLEYDSGRTPGENMKELTAKLERKKSLRESAFHQGTFGLEKLEPGARRPVLLGRQRKEMPSREKEVDQELAPEKYLRVNEFGELGGSRGESSFIAVVHIDGNAMGTRVAKVYENCREAGWEKFRDDIRSFSDGIDSDFKDAYKSMISAVEKNLDGGKLAELELEGRNFPVRRIITAGDDICYVTEGRIGVESAAALLKALWRKGYAACAGVAIVHQKYPFYKAYELSESLCSNAKRFGAGLSQDGTGRDVSCMDWHIDFGELKDSLEEIRAEYAFGEKGTLELRPYIVEASEEILRREPVRQYRNFRTLITKLLSLDIAYARGKLKNLRPVLKQGEEAARHYLQFNQIEEIARDGYQGVYANDRLEGIGIGRGLERKLYVTGEDGKKRSLLFDAIEMMDTYIAMEGVEN